MAIPNITIAYVTGNEFELLATSIKAMYDHDNVKNIVVLHTDVKKPDYFGEISCYGKKIHEYHECFGSGFSTSIVDGGFSQIEARNHVLKLSDNYDDEWLLFCDSDEVFLIDVINEKFKNLEESSEVNRVLFEIYCFFTPYQYYHPSDRKMVMHGQLMKHPYLRMWKKNLNVYYFASKIIMDDDNYVNKSRHCVRSIVMDVYRKISVYISEPCFLHTHDIVKKIRFDKIQAAKTNIVDKFLFGKHYEELFKKREIKLLK